MNLIPRLALIASLLSAAPWASAQTTVSEPAPGASSSAFNAVREIQVDTLSI